LVEPELELRAHTLQFELLHQPFFVMGFFKIGFPQTSCPGCLQTAILLIFASRVARIIVMSHQCLAWRGILIFHFRTREV
jgi:hypothetical protein